MLRVIVQLVPGGDESRVRTIAEMVLANDGAGDQGVTCAYEGWIGPEPWTKDQARYGKVKKHDRRQSVWVLVAKMIEACMPKFSPDRYSESLAMRLKEHLKEDLEPKKVDLTQHVTLDVNDLIRRVTPKLEKKMRKRRRRTKA